MILKLLNTKVSFFLLVFALTSVYSQTKEAKAYIVSKTNVSELNKLADHYLDIQKKYSALKLKPAQKTNKGTFVGWSEKGEPIYCSLENESAGQSSNIDDIRTGGQTNLDLDGSGIEIGLWDLGAIRDTHQEFDVATIENVDVTTPNNHATHVGGILVASGVIAEAQGMTPESSLHVYDANGWNAGLAAWSASGGILSNHSYILGNPRENYELYGVYDDISSSWDSFSYYAPYHLIVTGASNSGDDGYNPDGSRYDLLSTNKLGKNTLVVGACYDVLDYTGANSVVQSVFTSWGPTDDWRIKPDITAVGVGVYSTRIASDTAYASANGCSFAAPIVTGGVALLQQYYYQLNEVYMLSATVRALVLSTANEAGDNDGPDFSNGWGLFNAESAANVITNNGGTTFIDEVTLVEGETYSKTIAVDGTDTLKVAICWNDPAGTPLDSYVNDPTPMLVNDLDLRVSNNDETYMPWLLEPNDTYDNYTDAAIKGDNYRDNIEIIEVKDIASGVYTITVSHKDILENDLQDFSIVISGLTEDDDLLTEALCESENFTSTDINEAEDFCDSYGVTLNSNSEVDFVTSITQDDWIRFGNFDFGDDPPLVVEIKAASIYDGGVIDIYADDIGETLVASVNINSTSSWDVFESFVVDLSNEITGIHDLYFVFSGGDTYLYNLDSFTFSNDETLTLSDFYNKDLNLKIYPSPVVSNLHVSKIVDKVVIRDLRGRVILIFNSPLDSINLESLQSGIYFIEISINELTKIKKIVKK